MTSEVIKPYSTQQMKGLIEFEAITDITKFLYQRRNVLLNEGAAFRLLNPLDHRIYAYDAHSLPVLMGMSGVMFNDLLDQDLESEVKRIILKNTPYREPEPNQAPEIDGFQNIA